jgi:hypothetical protein
VGHPTILGRDKEVAELNLDKFDFQTSVNAAKAIVGLRPSFSAQVRSGEPGVPVDSL